MKINPTKRHLEQYGRGELPSVPPPLFPPPLNREHIRRLSWGHLHRPTKTTTYELLAETIRYSSAPRCIYFVDTGVITAHEVPSCFWDALLSQRVVVLPSVLYELRDWLQRPFYNERFRDAVRHLLESPSVHFRIYDIARAPWNLRQAARYYIDLLVLRKLFAVAVHNSYAVEHGSPPTNEEVQRQCQKITGDRGWRLAKKGIEEWTKPNFTTDEELVVWAILTALWDAQEVVILTRDGDVMEQFYKLLYLIDTHYRSMLVADEYSIAPWKFAPTPMSDDWHIRHAFCGTNDRLIRLPSLASDWMLPHEFYPVVVYCWLLGGPRAELTCQPLSFCAEAQMNRLIDVKSLCSGRNTGRLQGENCHFCVDPSMQDVLVGMSAVGVDKMQEIDGFTVSVVDSELALCTKEGRAFAHVSPIWYAAL